jgi:hypothetical protein
MPPKTMRRVGTRHRLKEKVSLGNKIAHLRGLDLRGLRAQWRGVFKRDAPAHLPGHLLLGVLVYRTQADCFGDLDPETKKLLDRTGAKDSRPVIAGHLSSFDLRQTELAPGTILIRSWNERSHRVMVMADGFAWNGKTYNSLSRVAFAITGTRWNGPRFFGLRDKSRESSPIAAGS